MSIGTLLSWLGCIHNKAWPCQCTSSVLGVELQVHTVLALEHQIFQHVNHGIQLHPAVVLHVVKCVVAIVLQVMELAILLYLNVAWK